MTTYKSLAKLFSLILIIGFSTTSCEVEDFGNPNAPTTNGLLEGASLADLQLLFSGVESIMRNDLAFHYNTVSIVGREYYDLTGVDPRYTGELLGANSAELDNNGFLTTRAFAQVYRVARNANNFSLAIDNSKAGLSEAEKAGLKAVTETLKAHSLLLETNRQFQNGMRLDVADANKPGACLTYEQTLAGLESMLDNAAAALSNAGDAFPVSLSNGFAGFDTPASFRGFNRALAARVNLYQGDKAGLSAALGESFMDMAGDMTTGAYHVFGANGNDITNGLQVIPMQTFFVAHSSFVADAEADDARLAKVSDLGAPVEFEGLSGQYQVALYPTNTTPVAMIRNEELILMMAEANVGSNNDGAVTAINAVRAAAGLPAYSGGTSDAELMDVILKERRYSLFGEGHRWIDLRRTGNLDRIPVDRDGSSVHTQFPRPVAEPGC